MLNVFPSDVAAEDETVEGVTHAKRQECLLHNGPSNHSSDELELSEMLCVAGHGRIGEDGTVVGWNSNRDERGWRAGHRWGRTGGGDVGDGACERRRHV